MSRVTTRLLILSDTHGHRPDGLPAADVAIHCGDVTRLGSAAELARAVAMLRALPAPLKLFVAGNHDLVLDAGFWRARSADADAPLAAADVLAQARADGVRYLAEGAHAFALDNGARLRVYASPHTPDFGAWAFQYPRAAGHAFAVPPRVDVAVTHGPPRGILDVAGLPPRPPEHAGCDALFRAVHAARPRVHCFGHIHEAWGALLAAWRPAAHLAGALPTCDNAIDAAASPAFGRHDLRPGPGPADGAEPLARLSGQRAVHVDLTQQADAGPDRTLFINAAIMDIRYRPTQLPWLVDMDLEKAESLDDAAATGMAGL